MEKYGWVQISSYCKFLIILLQGKLGVPEFCWWYPMSFFLFQNSYCHVGYVYCGLVSQFHASWIKSHCSQACRSSITHINWKSTLQAASMTSNAVPIPLVPSASFHTKIAQMVWLNDGPWWSVTPKSYLTAQWTGAAFQIRRKVGLTELVTLLFFLVCV